MGREPEVQDTFYQRPPSADISVRGGGDRTEEWRGFKCVAARHALDTHIQDLRVPKSGEDETPLAAPHYFVVKSRATGMSPRQGSRR